MSQTPTTPQTSPRSSTNNQETSPFVFTFGESSNTALTGTSQPMFVFTGGTMAAQRDAALLTPETSPSLPLNASLDMLDGIVLSDVDSSAEQDVERDQEEKVADDETNVSRRVVVPPREIRNLRTSFRVSMRNIASAMNQPLASMITDIPRVSGSLSSLPTDEHVADVPEQATVDTEDETLATDDEEDTVTEIAFESDTEDELEDFGPEIVDDTSLPIQQHLFPRTSEESKSETKASTSEEEPTCSVCYCDLTVKNSVTALCGHTYCNKCFFRWMETNATCACCRRPFDSKTNLTDEQLDREYDECYIRYQHLLIRHNTALQQSNRVLRQNVAIEERNRNLMDRQIRLREMIDYSRGYNDGCVAAHDKIINGGKGIESKCWKNLTQSNEWANGFNKAYNHEMRKMKRKMHKLEKINDRNQTKRRCAFKNFNRSDDEEEAFA